MSVEKLKFLSKSHILLPLPLLNIIVCIFLTKLSKTLTTDTTHVRKVFIINFKNLVLEKHDLLPSFLSSLIVFVFTFFVGLRRMLFLKRINLWRFLNLHIFIVFIFCLNLFCQYTHIGTQSKTAFTGLRFK